MSDLRSTVERAVIWAMAHRVGRSTPLLAAVVVLVVAWLLGGGR